MFIRPAASLLAFVLFAAPVVAAPPAASIFGHVPDVSNVVLSPDGNTLAWGDASGAAPTVVIFDLGTRAKVREIAVPTEMQLRDLDWADDETLLMTISKAEYFSYKQGYRYEYFRVIAADKSGGPGRVMLMADNGAKKLVTSARLLAWRTARPKTIVMSSMDFIPSTGEWVESVFDVDTTTGKGTRTARGGIGAVDWIADVQGVVRAYGDFDGRDKYIVYARSGETWKEIHAFDEDDAPTLIGISADGLAITALGRDASRRQKLLALPLDGSAVKVLHEDATRDVTGVRLNRYTGAPAAVVLGGSDEEVVWLDQAVAARARALAKAFPGRRAEVMGRSQNGERVLTRVSSPAIAPVYYIVDFAKKSADVVGEEYPALTGAALGVMIAVTYPARDGTQIPAYLTMPPGFGDKPLPLVVLPHGGPRSRDSLEFNWLTQFLATRGYAVLQPQFRGSTGFGEAFKEAGVRQWGGLMQDDVTDGVQWMIKQGRVDPARICIVGASYGGYAALAGAAFTPDLYACAVSIAGVSDLPIMLGQTGRTEGMGSLLYWREDIGEERDPRIIERSPQRAADKIKAPILLIHGVDDSVVYIQQSEIMAAALKKRGKPHVFVKLPGEDHWLSGSEGRTRVLVEVEQFLATHLKP